MAPWLKSLPLWQKKNPKGYDQQNKLSHIVLSKLILIEFYLQPFFISRYT